MGLRKEREAVEDALAERARAAHTRPNHETRFITDSRGETVANPAFRPYPSVVPNVTDMLDDLGDALGLPR